MYPDRVNPPHDSRTTRKSRLILIALWFLFYASFTLFTPPLLDDADSVHAEVAREMLLRHDFVTLYANGIRYLEKAPLYYWAEAACMAVLGPTAAATRIPLALAVLALALLLEAFARQASALSSPSASSQTSARSGLYAGLITLSSFGIFIFSRINIPDILVSLLLAAALYCYFLTKTQALPSLLLCCLFDAFLALNILTKGLIGILFPVAIVALHLLLTRGWRGTLRRLLQFHPIASTATLLFIAVPWHVLIALANPTYGHPGSISHATGHWEVPLPTDGNVRGWTWFYFANEQFYRYLNLRIPHVNFAGRPEYDTVPLALFYGLIFVWLLPWSAFLPTALAQAFSSFVARSPQKQARHSGEARISVFALRPLTQTLRTLPPQARTNLLLLLWAAVPLAFFTFSTRQEYYVLPSLPPLILLIANFLATPARAPHPLQSHLAQTRVALPFRALLAPSPVLLILGTLISLTLAIFLLHTRTPAPSTDLAALLRQNPADYALSFGHFLDLNAQALGLFRLPLALTALAFFLGPLANYLLRRNGHPHTATLALAAAAFLFLFAAHSGLVIFSHTITSAQLAEAIRPQLQPPGSLNPDLIAIHGEYEDASTLGFYLRRSDLHIIEGRSSNLWYGSFFPDASPIFDSPQSIIKKWPGPQRIFLWQDLHDPDRRPLALPPPVYVLATSGGKQILSNQPNH